MNERKYDQKKGITIEYSKPKWRAFVFISLFIMGIFLLTVFSIELVKVIANNETIPDIAEPFAILIASAFFLLVSIGSLLSYFGDDITIFDSYITIKRTAFGKFYIIAKSFVIAKSSMDMSVRGTHYGQIILYLKNGKKVSTGLIDCNANDFSKIDSEFKFHNLSNIESLREELEKYKNSQMEEKSYTVKTNYFFPILTFFPLAVLIICVVVLMFGWIS